MLGRHPGCEQLADLLGPDHLLAGLALLQLELPAPVGILDAHVGRKTRGVADLQGDERQARVWPGGDVEHQPVLVVPQALPLGPEHAAHGARGTIAADQIGGPQSGLGATGDCNAAQHHTVVLLLEAGDLTAHARLDAVAPCHKLTQQRFQLRLIEEGHVPPAVVTLERDLHSEQGGSHGVGEAHLVHLARRLEDGGHLVTQTQALEVADGLAVEAHRARQHHRLGRALENNYAQSRVRQLQSRQGPDGAVTHDCNVEVELSHGGIPRIGITRPPGRHAVPGPPPSPPSGDGFRARWWGGPARGSPPGSWASPSDAPSRPCTPGAVHPR